MRALGGGKRCESYEVDYRSGLEEGCVVAGTVGDGGLDDVTPGIRGEVDVPGVGETLKAAGEGGDLGEFVVGGGVGAGGGDGEGGELDAVVLQGLGEGGGVAVAGGGGEGGEFADDLDGGKFGGLAEEVAVVFSGGGSDSGVLGVGMDGVVWLEVGFLEIGGQGVKRRRDGR